MDDLRNTFNKKKVLITGDTGFKGRWLVRSLQHLGAEVYGVSNSSTFCRDISQSSSFQFNYESLRLDILDKVALQNYFENIRPEFVFHLAAQSIYQIGTLYPYETFESNMTGTLNVVSSSLTTTSVNSLVVATTDKVYENNESSIAFNELSVIGGIDPYSASKACADILTRSLAEFYNPRDIKVSTVRAGNIVGGGDWGIGRLVPDIYQAASSGKSLKIRNLTATRPFQFVLDAIYGYLLVSKSHTLRSEREKGNFDAFNVGPSHSLSVQEVVKLSKDVFGTDIPFESNEIANHEAQKLKIDSSKIRSFTNWQPMYSPTEAIKTSFRWYKENGYSTEISSDEVRKYFDLLEHRMVT